MSDTQQFSEADDEISLLDLLQTVVDNLRLLVLGPLAVGLLALAVAFVIPPTYTAKTQFLPPQQQQSSASALIQSLGAMGGLAGAAAGIKNPADQYVAFLKSASVLDAMVDRFELMQRYDVDYKVDARKKLQDNTKVTAGKDGIIQLELDDNDKQLAADMANGYVEELRKLMNRLALTDAQLRRAFFEKKMQATRDDLAKADQALRAIGISGSVVKSSPAAAVEVVARLRAAVTAQEIKIANMRGFLADSSPDTRQAMTELANLKGQLAQLEKGEASSGKSDQEDNYVSRFRDYKYQEALFEIFAKQYELARVDEAREGAVVQVVDKAMPPEKKSKPQKARVAIITTLASGMLLLLFVFVRQALRNAAQSAETASKLGSLKASWHKAIGR